MLVLTVVNVHMTDSGQYADYRWKVEVNGQVIDSGTAGWHSRRAGWRELLRRVIIARDGDDPLAWLASERFDRTVMGVLKEVRRVHPSQPFPTPSAVRRIVQEVRGKLGLTIPEGRRGDSVEKLGL